MLRQPYIPRINLTLWCYPSCVCMLSHFSHVQLCAILWTVACQAPLSMEFSRQEYWSGLPCPPPRALPNPGIKPMSLTSPALAGGFFTTSATWEAPFTCFYYFMCKSICMYMYKVIHIKLSLLDGITDLINMSLSKLLELVMDREAWRAAVHEVTKVRHNWVTELNWTEPVSTCIMYHDF